MPQSATILATTVATSNRALASADGASMIGGRAREHRLERDRAGAQARQIAFVQLLADTMTLRDLYAKHGAQASGPLARVFELICERHRVEHARLAELLGAHVRAMGGAALVMAADVAATTRIPRPPRGREPLEAQVERLLNAHEGVAQQSIALVTTCGEAAMSGAERDDTALVASELILTGKLHVWLLAEHLRHVSNASATVAQAACIAGRLVLPFC